MARPERPEKEAAMPYYLGKRPQGDWVLFASPVTPTKESHGPLYTRAQGPFRTRLAARWFNRYGRGNIHVHTVAEAERLAQEAARENLVVEQWLFEEDLTAREREEMVAFEAYERAVDEGVGKPISSLEPALQVDTELVPA
jgi:hypothetical protein